MRALSVIGALALLGIGGCYPDPIQLPDKPRIMIGLATDFTVPTEIDTIYVEAERLSEDYVSGPLDAALLPGTIRLDCPSDYCDNLVIITVTAKLGPTDEIARRSARVSYVSDQLSFLPMPLCKSCREVTCGQNESCYAGRCVDRIYRDEDDPLPAFDGGLDLDTFANAECSIVPSTSCASAGVCPTTAKVTYGSVVIDANEVTQADYAAFLASNPSIEGQSAQCAENHRLEPDTGCFENACPEGEDCSAHPQTCVDWCDARAYCAWAGKHLCGGISAPLDYTDFANPLTSEWSAACTNGGARDYPYGPTYDDQRCNGGDANLSTTIPVGSSGCGDGGAVDLSGNVAEWEDTCLESGSSGYECRIRGGSYSSDADDLRCDAAAKAPFESTARDVGFRCCG